MTELSYAVEKTDQFNPEIRNYLDANLHSLQQARLDKRNDAMLEDIFEDRNPYFLRTTRKVAFELVSFCLDSYLLSADEILFASFSRELSAYAARRSEQFPEPAAILELFAQDELPLRIELLEAYDRAVNRLTHQFLVDFCDEDGKVNWEQLACFLSESEAQVNKCEIADQVQ